MADLYAFQGDWKIFSILAAFLSVLASIILLMASRFFSYPKLEQTAKSEFVFAASTVILVLFVAVVLPLVEKMAVEYVQSLYGAQWELIEANAFDLNNNPLGESVGWGGRPGLRVADITIAYLNNIAGCSATILNFLFYADIIVQTLLSIVMEIMMSELTTGFFMTMFSERITNFANIITFYLIIYYLTYHILMFLKHFGMFFFTVGVLLRAFPPTRGAGAFVMALCIGMYFVFPLSFILMALTFSESGTIPYVCDIPSLPGIEASTGGAFDINKGVFGNSLNLKYYTNDIMEGLQKIGHFVNALSIMLCFLPILAFMVTLSFVLSASSFFGATIPEVGKGLVKLL